MGIIQIFEFSQASFLICHIKGEIEVRVNLSRIPWTRF